MFSPVSLHLISCLLSVSLVLTDGARLASRRTQGLPVFSSPALGPQACGVVPGLCGCWGSELGPCAYRASTLPTRPPPSQLPVASNF